MSEVDYIRLSGPRPVTMRGRAAFSTSWARDSVDRRDHGDRVEVIPTANSTGKSASTADLQHQEAAAAAASSVFPNVATLRNCTFTSSLLTWHFTLLSPCLSLSLSHTHTRTITPDLSPS